VGGFAALACGGFELVSHGVLPGRYTLDRLDGACAVSPRPEVLHRPGPTHSGTFASRARGRQVGYSLAYPPGHRIGDRLPVALVLHAFGENHTTALAGMSLGRALAIGTGDAPRPPIALVSADGGDGYWNPHPGDDPLGMLVDELIPMCRRLGLSATAGRVGVMGISMGGYGALLFAERRPRLTGAVAAISPALWTVYAQARSANPGAYASVGDFRRDDVVTHAAALTGVPTRIVAGNDDPFAPGVRDLAAALPAPGTVSFGAGCHDSSFFASQQPAALDFLARHLSA
jgi:S-formylglutathione hydrolase FrmB